MGIYVFVLAIVIVGFLFQQRKNVVWLNIISIVVLFIYCAFRGENVGADTSNYLLIYTSKYAIDNYENEFLFYNIVKWMQQWGCSGEECQIIMALLTYVPFAFLIVKKSLMPSLSILLFVVAVNGYYLETYNIVRQSIAVVFLLWSYVLFGEKRWQIAIAFFAMAIGVHNSSLIYLPMVLLALLCKFSYKTVAISILGSLLFAFIFSNISFLTNIVKGIQNIDILGFGKYSYFTDYKLDLTRNMNGLITLLLPHSFLCLYAYNKMKDNLLIRIYFCGVVFLNLVSVMPISYRMAYGLTVLELLIYPIIMKEKCKYNFVINILLGVLIVYWLVRLNSIGNIGTLIPYKFI